MIFQIFNLVAMEIRLNKIILDIKKLLRLEYELQVKLVDISFKFLNNNKLKVRYKKIEDIIKIMETVTAFYFGNDKGFFSTEFPKFIDI